MIYFACLSTYGYSILVKTDYLPPIMGGAQGNQWKNVWIDFPIVNDQAYAREMKVYYLFSLGYHVMSTAKHLYDSWYIMKRDFLEMLLHHVLTLALYMLSYMINITKVGSLVMFLHDIADVPVAGLKALVETTSSKLTVVVGSIIMPGTWFYTRLWVFPQLIYFCFIKHPTPMIFPHLDVEGHRD